MGSQSALKIVHPIDAFQEMLSQKEAPAKIAATNGLVIFQGMLFPGNKKPLLGTQTPKASVDSIRNPPYIIHKPSVIYQPWTAVPHLCSNMHLQIILGSLGGRVGFNLESFWGPRLSSGCQLGGQAPEGQALETLLATTHGA